MRKRIQITFDADDAMYALCDDDTVWLLNHKRIVADDGVTWHDEYYWKLLNLPPIPQDEQS